MKRGVYVDGIIEEVVTTATETYQVQYPNNILIIYWDRC